MAKTMSVVTEIWNSNMGVVLMFLSQEELQDFEYSLELSFESDNCCS